MEHFQLHKSNFRYDSGEIGPIMSVEVRYELGGSNFLSGTVNARGVYLHVTPTTIKEHEYEGQVSKSRVVIIGGSNSGLKTLLLSQTRCNQKKVEEVARRLDKIAPEIAKLAWTDKRAALMLAKQQFVA
jgi:hypothetical protein